MKTKEIKTKIHNLSFAALPGELKSLQSELAKNQMSVATGSEKNWKKNRLIKRQIAQILTRVRDNQLNQNAEETSASK